MQTARSTDGLFIIFKVSFLNVPTDTTIINPVNAAIGICSIKAAPNRIKVRIINEATIPETLLLPPAAMLTRLCPIIAQPPIPLKNPERTFAAPCAKHSRLPFLVSLHEVLCPAGLYYPENLLNSECGSHTWF